MGKIFETEEIKAVETNHKPPSLSSKEFARMAMTIYKYLNYTFDELEHAGFKGVEFLAKTELFLKSVTSTYPEKSFNQILTTLERIDPRFPETKFYNALVGLRALCNEGNETIEIMNEKGIMEKELTEVVRKELVFFVSILIEKLLRSIRDFRSQKESTGQTNESYRNILEDKFDECVIQSLHLL